MIFEIDPHGGVPIYRQVMEQIRRQIMTGLMAEGEQLEPVKSLAARLKVNPMTISKAYGFLVEEGLVVRQRGVGLFVRRIRADRAERIKTQMLEEALRKAASLAAQMKIPEEKALRLFAGQYRKISTRKGSK